MSKILIVEDDRSLVEILEYNLRKAGHEIVCAYDGMEGLRQAQVHSPDLIILDVMLPALNGLDVCRRLRRDPHTQDVLILMLTAKTEEADQLVGFSLGADDYVTKPYSMRLLLERVKALERRRRQPSSDQDIIALHGVRVDRNRHQASAAGRPLQLTGSEFRLVDTLIRQPGRAFTRSELISAALGEDTIVLERTIDVHVRAIRRKLGPLADVIQTVRGVGYRFAEPVRGRGHAEGGSRTGPSDDAQ